MKNSTKIFAAILSILGVASPYVGPYLANLAASHPSLASLGVILSVLGALFHSPKA